MNRMGISSVAISLAVFFLGFQVFPSNSFATIKYEGTATEITELQAAVEAFVKDSLKAQAIIDNLKKASTGEVKIKFGDTIDIAIADKTNKVITIDKKAVEKMKQVGTGKALEQFSVPYLIGHEAWHILNPSHTENQTVSKINEIRVEKKSSKRTRYTPVKKDKKLLLPFDDKSSVDVTEALKTGTGGSPAIDIWQESNEINLVGTGTLDSGLALSLDPLASQHYLDLELPDGDIQLQLKELNFTLFNVEDTDFNLSINDFHMEFESFDYFGNYTGTNIIDLYLPHQTPYGSWLASTTGNISFDFSGDLGWENSLFSGLAIEAINNANISFDAAEQEWFGTADLVGVKFAPIPEPSTYLLFGAGLILIIGLRKRR